MANVFSEHERKWNGWVVVGTWNSEAEDGQDPKSKKQSSLLGIKVSKSNTWSNISLSWEEDESQESSSNKFK